MDVGRAVNGVHSGDWATRVPGPSRGELLGWCVDIWVQRKAPRSPRVRRPVASRRVIERKRPRRLMTAKA
jgi:hypothetical protein